MSKFDTAVAKVLKHEGGFVNDPADTGGATNWGISLRFVHNIVGNYVADVDYIRNLSIKEAERLYKEHFWDKMGADNIKSYPIAFTLFDQAINRGPHIVINEVRNLLGQASIPMTEQRAYMPSDTLKLLNSVDEKVFLEQYLDVARQYYRDIVARRPSNAKFLNGWLKRVTSIENYVMGKWGVINAKNTAILAGATVLGVSLFYLMKQIKGRKVAVA